VVSDCNGVAIAAVRLGKGDAAVRDVFPLAPGAVFPVVGSATLGSDDLHGAVAADTADSVEGGDGAFTAVTGDRVSKAGDADGSASYILTLSI
jgi:hypothetical protein